MRSAGRTVLALTFLLASVAVVQAASPVRVNVPFDFVVQGHVLPAGTYVIRHADVYNSTALRFDGENGKVVNVFAEVFEPHQVGEKLVFADGGNLRVLKSLVTRDGTLSFPSVSPKLAKQGHRSNETQTGN